MIPALKGVTNFAGVYLEVRTTPDTGLLTGVENMGSTGVRKGGLGDAVIGVADSGCCEADANANEEDEGWGRFGLSDDGVFDVRLGLEVINGDLNGLGPAAGVAKPEKDG